jgi:hypothetical protein
MIALARDVFRAIIRVFDDTLWAHAVIMIQIGACLLLFQVA